MFRFEYERKKVQEQYKMFLSKVVIRMELSITAIGEDGDPQNF